MDEDYLREFLQPSLLLFARRLSDSVIPRHGKIWLLAGGGKHSIARRNVRVTVMSDFVNSALQAS